MSWALELSARGQGKNDVFSRSAKLRESIPRIAIEHRRMSMSSILLSPGRSEFRPDWRFPTAIGKESENAQGSGQVRRQKTGARG